MNLYLITNEKGRAVVVAGTRVEASIIYSAKFKQVEWLGMATYQLKPGILCKEPAPQPSEGTRIAEEARAKCNALTPEQREAGLARAMSIIYAEPRP
jgi:hypothetical protein